MFNMYSNNSLPNIWRTIVPLPKYKSRVDVYIECLQKAHSLRYKPPWIYHVVVGLILKKYFHTEDPDRVGDILNIFLLTSISLLSGSKTVLVVRMWDTELDSSTIMMYDNTVSLLQRQDRYPIVGW